MTKQFLSIKIEPERITGKILKALLSGEDLNISASANDNDNPNAPQFVSKEGISIWIKESKFDN
jgi:hypothetical protein